MFDVCYYENYRNESRLQTEAGASPTFDPGPSHVIYRVWRQRATLWPPETTDQCQTQTDSSQWWPESPSVASLATPATSSKQAACNHPLHLLMRNFVRGDNYINDQDKQFRYKHDLIMRCHPGCYVQSVLLWRCDPVVGSGAVIGCCWAECETWHLLPPRLIGQLAPAHRGLLLGSLIMMECQGLSRY